MFRSQELGVTMLRMRNLFVIFFILGAFGAVYLYADPVAWYSCDTSNAGPSVLCVKDSFIVCGLAKSAGHGWIPGTIPDATAKVTSGPPPVVGKCVGQWWYTCTCNNSFPCTAVCSVCGETGYSATSETREECQDQ